MRLLDLNVLLQAEMTDLPTFSYTWNLKRYSFWMRLHRLGHYKNDCKADHINVYSIPELSLKIFFFKGGARRLSRLQQRHKTQ